MNSPEIDGLKSEVTRSTSLKAALVNLINVLAAAVAAGTTADPTVVTGMTSELKSDNDELEALVASTPVPVTPPTPAPAPAP